MNRLTSTLAYLAQWAIDYNSDYIVATPTGWWSNGRVMWQTFDVITNKNTDVITNRDTAKDFRLFRWVKE